MLRLPLPLAPRRCRCGGRLDALGDHRSACAQVGVLAHRAGPLERAAARICREAGARVATYVALRDMNLDAPATDGRRIEVVANGLHVWRGAQIAVDTTLVSPLQRDGQPRPPRLALQQATSRKHRTYPELLGAGRVRCRLVVLGMEVGGRISNGASAFLHRLARVGPGSGHHGRRKPPDARCRDGGWRSLPSPACKRTPARYLSSLPCPLTPPTAPKFRWGTS